MLHQHQNISDYLRQKYFKHDYMSFGLQSGYYVLSVNSKKYEIEIKTFQQYQELRDYVESSFQEKYPELFL